jgi:hypothetical protein
MKFIGLALLLWVVEKRGTRSGERINSGSLELPRSADRCSTQNTIRMMMEVVAQYLIRCRESRRILYPETMRLEDRFVELAIEHHRAIVVVNRIVPLDHSG